MKYLKQFMLLLLGFIALSALVTGSLLLYKPSGSLLNIPYGSLSHTPFSDYSLPAILLLIVGAFGSGSVWYAVYRQKALYETFVAGYAIGIIVCVVVTGFLLDEVPVLLVTYLVLAVLLFACARVVRNQRIQQAAAQQHPTPVRQLPKKSHVHKHRKHRNK